MGEHSDWCDRRCDCGVDSSGYNERVEQALLLTWEQGENTGMAEYCGVCEESFRTWHAPGCLIPALQEKHND